MSVLSAVCLCTGCMLDIWQSEEGIRFPRAGVTDGCEPTMWELKIGPGSCGRVRVLNS